MDVYGLLTHMQEIAGSSRAAIYTMDRIHINDDVIGDLENDLRRRGWSHEFGIKYNLPLGIVNAGINF